MLTGNIGARIDWRGKLIVQVEHDERAFMPPYAGMFWRDATVNDLLACMRMKGCRLDASFAAKGSEK